MFSITNKVFECSADFAPPALTMSSVSCLHLNARSVKSKEQFDDFSSFVLNIKYKFDVIVVTESWLSKDDALHFYTIPSYNSEFYYRTGQSGGGIIVYVSEQLSYSVLENCNIGHCEEVWLKIELGNVFITIGSIYRPPSFSVTHFVENLENAFEKFEMEKRNCILIGDFNIDLLTNSGYLNMVKSSGFSSLLQLPTRSTATTSTCIDHVYTNITNLNHVESGTISTSTSDHDAIYCVFFSSEKLSKKDISLPSLMYNFKNLDEQLFMREAANLNFENVYLCDNPDVAYQTFVDKFMTICKKFIVSKAKGDKYFKKPWITQGILKSIAQRDRLHKKLKRQPFNRALKFRYEFYKKLILNLCRKAEKQYFCEQFDANKNDSRRTWQTINEALKRRKKTHVSPNKLLKPDGTYANSVKDVCDRFNDFFVGIGAQLQQACPRVPSDFTTMTPNFTGDELHNFDPVQLNELEKIINNLNSKKSFGVDMLHPRLLKLAMRAVMGPLLYIFNLSFSTGIVPSLLKTARITPVYKGSGSPYSPSNYRPISILSVCAKILEKVVYSRIINTIGRCIYKFQYGFKKDTSTADALSELIDTLNDNLNKGNISLGVFIDLKKAFDTVDHQILLGKLTNCGIQGRVIAWIKNYLENRSQYVQIESSRSTLETVTVGVPQGSNLGPLLFLVYVNDLQYYIRHGTLRLFADDTNIFYHGKDPRLIRRNIDEDMTRLNGWLCMNKLTPNLAKSNYITISTSSEICNVDISLRDCVLERVQNVKYLGVVLDDRLNWKKHISSVCKKIAPVIGVLSKLRWVLPKRICYLIYMSLIHCHFMYCLEVWGCATETALNPLIVLQKKVIRILSFAKCDAHTEILFRNLKVLSIRKLYFYKICLLVYKELNNIAKCNIYGFSHINHRYSTRKRCANDLQLPTATGKMTNHVLCCFKYVGPRFYNTLPTQVRECTTVRNFKKNIKVFISSMDVNVYKLLYPHK